MAVAGKAVKPALIPDEILGPEKSSAAPESSSSHRPTRRSASSQKKIPKVASYSKTPRALEDDETRPDEENEDRDSDSDLDAETDPDEPEIGPDDAEAGSRSQLPALQNQDLEPELRAVSASDPLRRYLEEVRRHPLLDPEEEVALVSRMRDQGDIEAAKRLVSANLRLVVKIAFEYRTIYSNVMDLIQEGNIGLMKAVSKYDPSKGARVGYYSSWWIRSYILKYLLENFRLVKIGTTQAQKKLFYHLMREKERLEAQGIFAGPKLLAEKFDVREKDVIEMEQRLSSRGGEVSIDAPVGGSDSDRDSGLPSLGSMIADVHESVDSVLEREEWLEILKARLPDFEKSLEPREVRILRDRLLAEEPKTLQEVADHYGLTRERARQIESKLIQKLRAFLADDLGVG